MSHWYFSLNLGSLRRCRGPFIAERRCAQLAASSADCRRSSSASRRSRSRTDWSVGRVTRAIRAGGVRRRTSGIAAAGACPLVACPTGPLGSPAKATGTASRSGASRSSSPAIPTRVKPHGGLIGTAKSAATRQSTSAKARPKTARVISCVTPAAKRRNASNRISVRNRKLTRTKHSTNAPKGRLEILVVDQNQ